jgi:hypothetical protein
LQQQNKENKKKLALLLAGKSDIMWTNSLPGNLTRVADTAPFQLVPLSELINQGRAQWVSSQWGGQEFSAFRILSHAQDAYLSTGDVILPGGANNQWQQLPIQYDPWVLLVRNDPAFSTVIKPTDYQWRCDDAGSGSDRQNMSLLSVSNRDNYQGQYTVLGDAVEPCHCSGLQDGRVHAAVRSTFVIDAGSLVNNNDPSRPPAFIANDQGTSWRSHDLSWLARSTPYANFYFCCNGCGDVAPQYKFRDLIVPAIVGACCANNTNNLLNCGDYGNPSHTGNDAASSKCNAFMNQFAQENIRDPNVQAYIVSRPGQLDPLMQRVCQTGTNGLLPICACQRRVVPDPNLPLPIQNAIQPLLANPKCSNPECNLPTAYQSLTVKNSVCAINTQICFATAGVTNNNGTISQGVKLTQDQRCQLNVNNATNNSATPTATATTATDNPPNSFIAAPLSPPTTAMIPNNNNTPPKIAGFSRNVFIGVAVGAVLLVLLVLFLFASKK